MVLAKSMNNEICKLKSKKCVLPNKIVDETGSHIVQCSPTFSRSDPS